MFLAHSRQGYWPLLVVQSTRITIVADHLDDMWGWDCYVDTRGGENRDIGCDLALEQSEMVWYETIDTGRSARPNGGVDMQSVTKDIYR